MNEKIGQKWVKKRLKTVTKEERRKPRICGALRDLVAFVQFKNCEKHPWRSVTKSNIPPWVFFMFLNCTNSTKLRKESHLGP